MLTPTTTATGIPMATGSTQAARALAAAGVEDDDPNVGSEIGGADCELSHADTKTESVDDELCVQPDPKNSTVGLPAVEQIDPHPVHP